MVKLVEHRENDKPSHVETAANSNSYAEPFQKKNSTQQVSKQPEMNEIPLQSLGGYPIVIVALSIIGLTVYSFLNFPTTIEIPPIFIRLGLLFSAIFLLSGLYILHPNEAALLSLFGTYRGTDRNKGLRWSNPLCRVRKVSLRSHSFISDELKVNDKRGNPIEIAAAIVWRVNDTARARFNVENYQEYVTVQSESAIRYIASAYAYDSTDEEGADPPEVTLRSGIHQISSALVRALQDRFNEAGLVVEDAKLTHLAYAPEIAGVMLRRQQAEAIIAARQKIVTGAVSMVEMALHSLTEHDLVHLDDERKASMISNLMVVLCAENEVKPVVNVGSLYT